MDISVYGIKLKKLLDKLLDCQLHICDDRNMNLLLSHLSGKDNTDLGETLLNLPLLIEWVEKVIERWEIAESPLPISLMSFTLNLTALLLKSEYRYYLFCSKNYLLKLRDIFMIKASSLPSNKLAYIKLFKSLTSHKAGLSWLITTQFWKDCVHYCFTTETVYVQKEAYEFTYQLLVSSTELCENFLSIACRHISNHLLQTTNCDNTTDMPVRQQILYTIKLVSFILESFIREKDFTPQKLKLPIIFIKDFNLEKIATDLFSQSAKQPEFLHELSQLILVIQFLDLIIDNQVENIPISEVRKIYVKNLQLFSDIMYVCNYETILLLCYNAESFVNIIKSRLPKTEEVRTGKCNLSLLYLIFLSVPVVALGSAACGTRVIDEEDEIKEVFYEEAMSAMCETSLRMIYKIRDVCTKDDENMFQIMYKSLLNIERCQKYYGKPEATDCFRCICHAFKDMITSMKDKPWLVSKFMNHEKCFSALCYVISKFITDFDITWTDAFEIVCLIDACLDCFNLMSWSIKVTSECLKLLKILISKNMTPSMVLLLDQTTETPLSIVPSILFTKLHDPNWEIRDSSLEVLHTLAVIAQNKFPSFQTIIIDSNLVPLVITISIKDGESFVRASALKCLQELTKIQQIWAETMANDNLPEKVMEILKTETEAIVRMEAATLMKNIYQFQTLPNRTANEICKAMYFLSISDLHWEVQVRALNFWRIFICKQLKNQGMIDGTFPNVTFSKENRKIVTLTEKEIQNRLHKVLQTLSQYGCLAVLVHSLRETSDISVSIKAVEIVKKITGTLREHNFISATKCDNPSSPNYIPNWPIQDSKSSSSQILSSSNNSQSDNVINQIVGAKDMSLLSSVYIGDSEVPNLVVDEKKIEIVTPEDFIKLSEKDLDSLIVERQQWLNKIDDLASLLDDMLKSYNEFDDFNAMDCY